MKVLVSVKRVPDYQIKVKVAANGHSIDTSGTKWIVNPFDEIAIEEAIRLKEAGKATEIVAVGIGPEEVQTQLRYALAMGADRGIFVRTDAIIDSDCASRVLVKIYEREAPQLVIIGKQAIDSDSSQTPQLMAERLKLPQACFASKLIVEGNFATVTREVDGGLETIKVSLPAIVSTDLRLNEPRYASLPNIMKAKKKELQEIKIEDLGVDPKPKIVVTRMSLPPKRQAGKKVENVAALVAALKNEAKVL